MKRYVALTKHQQEQNLDYLLEQQRAEDRVPTWEEVWAAYRGDAEDDVDIRFDIDATVHPEEFAEALERVRAEYKERYEEAVWRFDSLDG